MEGSSWLHLQTCRRSRWRKSWFTIYIRYTGALWEDMKLVVEESPEKTSQYKNKIHIKSCTPPAYFMMCTSFQILYETIFVNKIFNIALNHIFLYAHTGITSAHLGRYGDVYRKRARQTGQHTLRDQAALHYSACEHLSRATMIQVLVSSSC